MEDAVTSGNASSSGLESRFAGSPNRELFPKASLVEGNAGTRIDLVRQPSRTTRRDDPRADGLAGLGQWD
jgi:hypothetical protein